MTVAPYHLACQVCRDIVASDGPAVATFSTDHDFRWVPFVEDLRTSSASLMHAACFATLHGVDALVATVHRHDEQQRRSRFQDFVKVTELEQQLRTLREDRPRQRDR